MDFNDFSRERRFRAAWEAIQIARPVHVTLFTFGESELPYFLVCDPADPGGTVSVRRGEVKVTRPLIITPENSRPEFQDFFENGAEQGFAEFLLSRTAAFSHLKFKNQTGSERIVSDSVEEAVARLNRQLDDEDEDRVAILTAPPPLAGLAVLRYAAERVMASAPGNVQELRERGFLP
jgi:hypothetical protein